MTTKKYFIAILVTITSQLTNVYATEIIASGSPSTGSGCGANCSWTLYDDGTFEITGTGDMGYYQGHNASTTAPWDAYKAQINRVVIADGITTVGRMAFWGADNLTDVVIPQSVKSVKDFAFKDCPSLSQVVLSEGIETLGDASFYGASLIKIELPQSLTTIGGNAFSGTNLQEVSIPKNVTTIGDSAFSTNTLEDVNFEEGSKLKTIGNSAFSNTSISTIEIPSGVETIGNNAFYRTGLTKIDIPEGVTTIGAYAFTQARGNSILETVTLPDSLTSIGSYAFYWADTLKSIKIPEGTTVSANAFRYAGLTDLILCDGVEMDLSAFTTVSVKNITASAEMLQKYLTTGAGALQDDAIVQCTFGDCQQVLKESMYQGKVSVVYLPVEINNPDGSISIYKKGRLVGYKNKRIYTVEEANRLSKPTGNRFTIRYK